MNKYYVVECLYDSYNNDRKRLTKEEAINEAKRKAARDSDGDNFGVFELVVKTNRPQPVMDIVEVTA